MKILIVCSKKFYGNIAQIKSELERLGHEILLPNYYGDASIQDKIDNMNKEEYMELKVRLFDRSEEMIKLSDAILVLNYDKITPEKTIKNYIGGATFLEMFVAYRMNKTIYLMNPTPEGILFDDIKAFDVKVINGDLSNI